MRYRIRFLLQEFDLPPGATVIGRSLDCSLTIEDPLVSRQHARIVIDDRGARLEDLGSRNGVRINGAVIREPTSLRDGDRIRLGTQDLVFCELQPMGGAHSKTTGVLRLCARCRLPYAREMHACPHCAATEQTDEGTLSTSSEDYRAQWSAQLMVEALERALVLGRLSDAERIGRRATARLDELILSGGAIDGKALGAVAAKVAEMTLATGDPKWALWVLSLYRRSRSAPPLEVAEPLADAVVACAGTLRAPLGALLEELRSADRTGSPDEMEAVTRLEEARLAVESAPQRVRMRRTSESPRR